MGNQTANKTWDPTKPLHFKILGKIDPEILHQNDPSIRRRYATPLPASESSESSDSSELVSEANVNVVSLQKTVARAKKTFPRSKDRVEPAQANKTERLVLNPAPTQAELAGVDEIKITINHPKISALLKSEVLQLETKKIEEIANHLFNLFLQSYTGEFVITFYRGSISREIISTTKQKLKVGRDDGVTMVFKV